MVHTNRQTYAISDVCSSSRILSAGVSKLHSDSTFNYYKVAVDAGVKMMEDAIATACRKGGMEAVCPGPSGCHFNDETM